MANNDFPLQLLLYRASEDGFGADAFHSKCDGKSNTMIIIKYKII